MTGRSIDRFTEILAILCVTAAVVILLVPSRGPDAGAGLAGLRPQEIQGGEGVLFRTSMDEVRRLVDGDRDPGRRLDDLTARFPRRHEVWALSARYHENMDEESAALVDYARAVRLQPDYLDEGSSLYLGARIGGVTGRELTRLRVKKAAEGLTGEEQDILRAAYFLVRRLAGGCE
ncbi:MAG: hypothetical protein P1S46_02585 [bacterium]|nr:hypothetical protein [bacterium]MDT8395011.1 hypothetical protein [bacterium]